MLAFARVVEIHGTVEAISNEAQYRECPKDAAQCLFRLEQFRLVANDLLTLCHRINLFPALVGLYDGRLNRN